MIAAIIAGGDARRLGGAPKWLMPTRDGRTIVARLADECREAGLSPIVVSNRPLFGADLPRVEDASDGEGPLAAVVAALAYAAPGPAIILGGDLPRVSAALLARLATAGDEAMAPLRDGRFEPMFSRLPARALEVARSRLARRELSLQGLFRELGAAALPLSEAEWSELADVDELRDLAAL